MTRLSLTAYEDATKASMIADWSPLAQRVTFETNEHGFANLSAFIPMSLDDAFRIYAALQFAHVVLSDGAFIAFEGRLEDPRIVDAGIEITAFGYWRSLSDVLYTGLWSTMDYRPWREMTAGDFAGSTPKKFSIDANNRLFIGLRKGETYATSGDNGRIGYQLPSHGLRDVVNVAFDYTLVGENTSYEARLISTPNDDYTGGTTEEWNVTSSNGTQSASVSQTLSGTTPQALFFQLDADSGTDNDRTPTADTGDLYLEITNLRIKTTASTYVYAGEVLAAHVELITSINVTQLSTSTALIAAGDLDMPELLYEGVFCDKAASAIAAMGDLSFDTYEVGVWEDQRLHYRVRGSEGRAWYTDVASIEVDSSVDTLWNSVAVEYRDTRGRTVRTYRETDAASKARYGAVARTRYVKWDTTDATTAENVRDVAIADGKDIRPRARVTMAGLFDKSGASYPLYFCRAGDSLTLRNLPPGSGGVVDNIRTMTISRTRYDADTDTLTPTPGLEAPSLEFMVASNTVGQTWRPWQT